MTPVALENIQYNYVPILVAWDVTETIFFTVGTGSRTVEELVEVFEAPVRDSSILCTNCKNHVRLQSGSKLSRSGHSHRCGRNSLDPASEVVVKFNVKHGSKVPMNDLSWAFMLQALVLICTDYGKVVTSHLSIWVSCRQTRVRVRDTCESPPEAVTSEPRRT